MNHQKELTVVAPSISPEEAGELILNNTPHAYLLVNKAFEVISFNAPAVAEMQLRYNKELHPGLCLLDLIEPSRQQLIKNMLESALAGSTNKTETDIISVDGDKIYFENYFLPAYTNTGEIAGIILHSVNITKRKLAGIAIKEAEERWRFALEASDQGAWDWNMVTDEVVYSDSYKKLYGFSNEDLKNELFEWQSRIHPDDRENLAKAIKEHSNSDNPYYETTYRIQLKDGRYKWIMARGKVLGKDETGKPVRMIGTHTDLTKTLETKEEIKKMNDRFAYAAKASSQALWEWNAVRNQAYMSPSFTELFGWAADQDHRFDQWHQYIHPDDRDATVKHYYDLLDDPHINIWQSEYRFLKADGNYAVVSDKAYIIRDNDGKVIKVIGATQDISLLKKTEEELYKSNERFDIMLRATNELLWEWDIPSNSIYHASEGLKKVYGVMSDEGIKTIEAWLKRVHPDDRINLNKVIGDLQNASHLQTFETEYRFKRDDGSYAHVNDRCILLKDENGRPLRMIGAAQDISERKRLENELLQNELEHKKLINQATVDSQEQERDEIGKELHDNINQVLTTTKLYLELALANEEMMKELVKKSSKNISSVINEIRQLSRSLMDPSLGDLGIIDAVNDLIDNINLARKIHIDHEIEEDIEDILDKKQKLTIFRIIQEALNNVIKHAKAKAVTIRLSQQDGVVSLEVEDNGVGFFHESAKRGAGLKNITNRVYLINGIFCIDSEPGKGCRIKISFPIK